MMILCIVAGILLLAAFIVGWVDHGPKKKMPDIPFDWEPANDEIKGKIQELAKTNPQVAQIFYLLLAFQMEEMARTRNRFDRMKS